MCRPSRVPRGLVFAVISVYIPRMKVVGFLLTLVVSAFPVIFSAPSAAGQSLTLPAVVGRPLAIPAGAPCTVSYYTTHARLRMAERDISKAEVVSGVKDACRNSNVYYQWWDGMYKYESGFLGVIMNRQGGVITVYWRTSGGGWSQPVDQLH